MSKFKYTKDSVERFRLVLEQLEVCADLIKSKSHLKSRMAIILLDNLIDILMFRYCEFYISRDRQLISIRPSQLTDLEAEEVQDSIEGKIRVLRNKIKKITKTEETIIRLCHSYRNDAQHNDSHNPETTTLFARIFFKVVCNFFVRLESKVPMSVGYSVVPEWFKKYTDSTHISLLGLASSNCKELSKGMGFTLSSVKKLLAADIEKRLNSLKESIEHELPKSSNLDKLFKYYGFEETLIARQIPLKFYQLRYRVAEGEEVSFELYNSEKQQMEMKYEEEFQKFTPKVSEATIKKIERGVRTIKNSPTMDKALKSYERFNQPLEVIEAYVFRASEDWDEYVQLQIDIARGK